MTKTYTYSTNLFEIEEEENWNLHKTKRLKPHV